TPIPRGIHLFVMSSGASGMAVCCSMFESQQARGYTHSQPASAMNNATPFPKVIQDEEQLDEVLTRPSPSLVAGIRSFSSPLVILGAGGKMGPTLAVLARRAAEAAGHPLEVLAVSRFTNVVARRWLESRGVATMSCDLLEGRSLASLPETANVLYLV